MNIFGLFSFARRCLVFLLIFASFPTSAAHGEQDGGNGWTIAIGESRLNVDSVLRGTRNNGTQFTVDAERDLGLARVEQQPWLRAEYRVSEQWRVYAEYLDMRRRGTVLRQTKVLLFGFLPLVVGTRYQTDLNLTNYRFGAARTLLKGENYEAGISVGMDLLDASLALRTITIPLVQAPVQKGLVPLPTAGLFGRYRLDGKNSFLASGESLPLHVGRYKANAAHFFVAYEHATDWGPRLGFAYWQHDFRLSRNKPGADRDARYGYQGPMFYLASSF